jgi:hypothetical protein
MIVDTDYLEMEGTVLRTKLVDWLLECLCKSVAYNLPVKTQLDRQGKDSFSDDINYLALLSTTSCTK